MRGALFWLGGASLAFFVTAGAFLLLANFAVAPRASDPIPQNNTSGQSPPAQGLALSFSEERLEELQRSKDQMLTLYLENRGDGDLASVNLVLTVSSEDTARPGIRRYRETVADLAPGEIQRVDLMVDLSASRHTESMAVLEGASHGDREIVEARAYPPGGSMVIETAILSP